MLIAVIGPAWLDIVRAAAGGQRTTFVRIEIAQALQRARCGWLPVLIDGARPPPEKTRLTDDLKALSRRHARRPCRQRFAAP